MIVDFTYTMFIVTKARGVPGHAITVHFDSPAMMRVAVRAVANALARVIPREPMDKIKLQSVNASNQVTDLKIDFEITWWKRYWKESKHANPSSF